MSTPTNADRAETARQALETYPIGSRNDVLVDLLTDLRHYCHQQDLDWEHALECAAIHYTKEATA